MTFFRRQGHYRTSKLGKRFWVDGHGVYRDAGSSNSEEVLSYGSLEKYPEVNQGQRWMPCFITPNAKCPVCELPVYYYQNQHGSRVFFDAPGWPWPKHPCTDNGREVVRLASGDPEARSRATWEEIQYGLIVTRVDPAAAFLTEYNTTPWTPAKIILRAKHCGRVFLILDRIDSVKTKKVFISCRSLASEYKKNSCVAIKGKMLSYFARSAMAGKEIDIVRYRNATALVDAMTSQTKDE